MAGRKAFIALANVCRAERGREGEREREAEVGGGGAEGGFRVSCDGGKSVTVHR